MKLICSGPNQAGKRYAIVTNGTAFWVMGCSINYRHGKDVVSWHKISGNSRQTNREFQDFAKTGMDFDTASALYRRMIKGKRKF